MPAAFFPEISINTTAFIFLDNGVGFGIINTIFIIILDYECDIAKDRALTLPLTIPV